MRPLEQGAALGEEVGVGPELRAMGNFARGEGIMELPGAL